MRGIPRSIASLAMLLFIAGFVNAASSAQTAADLKPDMEATFAKFKADFDRIAASSVVKKTALTPVNSYFFKALKTHQPYYSLIKTNHKGIVINEVIRLVEKPSAKKQNLSAEAWFKQVSTKLEEYTGLIKQEETGRYYLFWAAPITKTEKGKEAFKGAVALKIDLWDCLQKYSKTTETPFLVRLGHLGLYSYKWNDTIAFTEEPLSIPGTEKITVRLPKAGENAGAATEAQAAAAPSVDSAKIKAAEDSLKALQAAPKKRHPGVIIVLILLLAAVTVVAVRWSSERRRRKLMQRIEEEPPAGKDGWE